MKIGSDWVGANGFRNASFRLRWLATTPLPVLWTMSNLFYQIDQAKDETTAL